MVEIRSFISQQLEALLPPKPRLTQYSESEVEEVTMMDFDINRGSEDSGRWREAYEEVMTIAPPKWAGRINNWPRLPIINSHSLFMCEITVSFLSACMCAHMHTRYMLMVSFFSH